MSEDSRVFQNEGLWKVWTWCLMRAAYEPHWAKIKVGRQTTEVWLESGQFIFGRYSAAKRLKMKPSTVRNRMQKLENMRNVDIKEDSKYSIISIVNWDIYQPEKNKEDIKEDSQGTVKGHKEELKALKEDSLTSSESSNGIPFNEILEAYHSILPELPRVKVYSKKRKGYLKARWNEDSKRQTVKWWNGYFNYVRKSDFLMGRIEPKEGRKPFKADFEWLITEGKFINTIEGKYHG
jgi:hypothetical protein